MNATTTAQSGTFDTLPPLPPLHGGLRISSEISGPSSFGEGGMRTAEMDEALAAVARLGEVAGLGMAAGQAVMRSVGVKIRGGVYAKIGERNRERLHALWRLGVVMAAARELVPHGRWAWWLGEVGMKQRVVERAMYIAKIDEARIAEMGSARAAERWLAERGTRRDVADCLGDTLTTFPARGESLLDGVRVDAAMGDDGRDDDEAFDFAMGGDEDGEDDDQRGRLVAGGKAGLAAEDQRAVDRVEDGAGVAVGAWAVGVDRGGRDGGGRPGVGGEGGREDAGGVAGLGGVAGRAGGGGGAGGRGVGGRGSLVVVSPVVVRPVAGLVQMTLDEFDRAAEQAWEWMGLAIERMREGTCSEVDRRMLAGVVAAVGAAGGREEVGHGQ